MFMATHVLETWVAFLGYEKFGDTSRGRDDMRQPRTFSRLSVREVDR